MFDRLKNALGIKKDQTEAEVSEVSEVSEEITENTGIAGVQEEEEEEETAKITPYYLNADKYPPGFQPFFPTSSTKNAFTVVKQIRDSLSSQIAKDATSPEMKENEYGRFANDNRAAERILKKIDALIAKINVLEGKTKSSLLSNPDKSFTILEDIVNEAQETMKNMSVNSVQQLNAMHALIDILQITRRAIPNVGELLKEKKQMIQSTINDALRHKSVIEKVLSSHADPKQKMRAIKENDLLNISESEPDPNQTTRSISK